MAKKYKYTPESAFPDRVFLTIGAIALLIFSFYLVSVEKAWAALIISLLTTCTCFGLAKRNKKNGLWIFLTCLAILFDIINIIATVQLVFK